MDLNMPVMGGEEAAAELRFLQSIGEVPPFPILAATAQHLAEAQRACADSGMDGLVEKPLRLDVLGTELRRVLPGAR
jgi:CheY-like chemotaxis protein